MSGRSDLAIPPDLLAECVELRHVLHEHPEVSHQERETARRIAELLTRHAIGSIRPLAATAGLIVDIEGATEGPLIALKADLDALPMQERCEVPFRSRIEGVMHACGHDAHAAILCAVAVSLHRRREQLRGCVRCIFQPAEECEPLGAREVLRHGVLDGASAVLACHVDPELPLGSIGGLVTGPRTAAADEITIEVRGRAAHGARPHLGVDAIAIAAGIVQEAQKLVSRASDPGEPMVFTIGRLIAGATRNSIAESARLEGILRTTSERQRRETWQHVRRVAEAIAHAHGGQVDVQLVEGEPVIVHDEWLVAIAREVAGALVGAANVTSLPARSLGADDFGFYQRAAPGLMLRLGVRNETAGMRFPLHHPEFFADDSVIGIGAALLANLTVRLLVSVDHAA